MKMKRILLITHFFICISLLPAQQTLPPYHWSWRYLDYLKTAGYLPELDITNRPLNRMDIARSLIDVEEQTIDPGVRKMIHILKEEFNFEIDALEEQKNILQKVAEKILPLERKPRIYMGGFGEFSRMRQLPDLETKFDYHLHPTATLQMGSRYWFYGNFRIFKEAEPGYIGKTFRNIHGYMEQGYFAYNSRYLQFKIGRDFLQIGPGRTGQLLISDNSRPFDMYHARIKIGGWQMSFFGLQLDKRVSPANIEIIRSSPARRFLNGHRISFNIKNRYYFGASEVTIYGGPEAGWELAFMNPAGFYYAVTSNGPHMPANFLYSLDWDLYLPHRLNFYGELLIDDLQVDKKSPGDLEPNEIGLLTGFHWTDPLDLPTSRINLEYVQIRNRTYNAPVNDWEKYLHRNKVIGYWLGNDFKLWHLQVEKWWRGCLRTEAFARIIRKGEGTVEGEFNTDFLNYTVEEGYTEPFPWGIVEKHTQLGFSLFYQLHRLSNLTLDVAYNQFKNYQHIEGQERNEWSFKVSLWIEWGQGMGR